MNIDDIIAFEQGDLSDFDTIKMFQSGINSGMVWQLQGCYGRNAKALLDTGICTPADEPDLTDAEILERLEFAAAQGDY